MKFKNDDEIVAYLNDKKEKEFARLVQKEVERVLETKGILESQSKLLTSSEVRKKFGMGASTLERYVRMGLKVQSGGYRFKRYFKEQDVVNFLNAYYAR